MLNSSDKNCDGQMLIKCVSLSENGQALELIAFPFFSRFNFHVLNHPGWLKVSPLTRYAPGSSPTRSPPAGAELGPEHSQTLKPVLCKPEPSEKLLQPPLEVGVAQVEGEAPMKEVVEENPAAIQSTGDQRELMESVRQIYNEHNYCRLSI